jgi:hypothetical protein
MAAPGRDRDVRLRIPRRRVRFELPPTPCGIYGSAAVRPRHRSLNEVTRSVRGGECLDVGGPRVSAVIGRLDVCRGRRHRPAETGGRERRLPGRRSLSWSAVAWSSCRVTGPLDEHSVPEFREQLLTLATACAGLSKIDLSGSSTITSDAVNVLTDERLRRVPQPCALHVITQIVSSAISSPTLACHLSKPEYSSRSTGRLFPADEALARPSGVRTRARSCRGRCWWRPSWWWCP